MHPVIARLLGLGHYGVTPPPAPGQARRTPIPNDMRGIAFEILKMKDYVLHFSGDPLVITTARKIVRMCPPKDLRCEQKHIFEWLKAHTRYVLDPRYREVLVTPARLLKEIAQYGVAQEDCDGLATLLATMLHALGHHVRFRFGGTKGIGIHHVWVRAWNGSRWVDMDLAEQLRYGQHKTFDFYMEEEI